MPAHFKKVEHRALISTSVTLFPPLLTLLVEEFLFDKMDFSRRGHTLIQRSARDISRGRWRSGVHGPVKRRDRPISE